MIGNICHLIHNQPFYFLLPLLFRSDVEYAILNNNINWFSIYKYIFYVYLKPTTPNFVSKIRQNIFEMFLHD